MMSLSVDMNNPWIVGFIVGIIAGVISSLIAALIIDHIKHGEYRRINRKVNIENGFSLQFGELEVKIIQGRIEEISDANKYSAFVLPANTKFTDDCIEHTNSALGAFFNKHYPEKNTKVLKDFDKLLKKLDVKKLDDGTYPFGTTIIMPEDYNVPARVMVTASTKKEKDIGINAEPSSICQCIKQVFATSENERITRLYMPVLGSGHGNLNVNDALLFIVLAIKHYSKKTHLKNIDIVIIKEDVKKLKDVYRLQYLLLLEGMIS